MSDLVTLTIDGVAVSVPKGTLVVDAAKKIGNDIPVFCYHPKLEPVGMCRMCLVEIGLPIFDRETGEPVRNADGSVRLNFGKGLQTGCTVRVSEGMVVRTNTVPVDDAREDIIEFILTSHPLDCPICDKGGECPLQNLTMEHGKGTSRMVFSDKLRLDKHVPLGELIYLDRERCIQCARCTRFQAEVVDDPVIQFHNRGRSLEIVTFSEPGFDSIWSGNTTDICPVGALTTADFRFGARPWELTPVAGICTHCPVGCNTTMSTRREALAGGRRVIKRIMPRQNEAVNEIWICDKGRFVHHYADSPQRLTQPLVRKDGELVPASWDEALDLAAGKLQLYKDSLAGLAGDRLSNEDLFTFQRLLREGLGTKHIDLADRQLAGGDVAARVGLSSGSNLKGLGPGDAILVVAADLHQEAPVWWLRVKQAAERGAALVVLNVRPTRLDKFATLTHHYEVGQALPVVKKVVGLAHVDAGEQAGDDLTRISAIVGGADRLVTFYGADGLSYDETDSLARMLANLLLLKRGEGDDAGVRAGNTNSGLVPVWPGGNTQGAWDMGIHPAFGPGYAPISEPGLAADAIYAAANDGDLRALYIVGGDPIGDGLMDDRGNLDLLIVQELFLTETAAAADIVLPAQSWAEREGTYTNGERRVQRTYPAIQPVGESRPDWQIVAQIAERIGMPGKVPYAAGLVFRDIAAAVAQYKGFDYRVLGQVEEQWPIIGRDDMYYGGTAYDNYAGLGRQWAAGAETSAGDAYELGAEPQPAAAVERKPAGNLAPVLPVPALLMPGTLVDQSAVIAQRVARPTVLLDESDASSLGVRDGDWLTVQVDGLEVAAIAEVGAGAPAGLALLRGVRVASGRVVTLAAIARMAVTEVAVAAD